MTRLKRILIECFGIKLFELSFRGVNRFHCKNFYHIIFKQPINHIMKRLKILSIITSRCKDKWKRRHIFKCCFHLYRNIVREKITLALCIFLIPQKLIHPQTRAWVMILPSLPPKRFLRVGGRWGFITMERINKKQDGQVGEVYA